MRFPKSIKYVKIPWQQVLAILILLLAFVFFRSERKEMMQIIPSIQSAKPIWLLIGFGITILYISLQAAMYITSFKAVGLPLKFWDAINLFLKRNFISVFLPAGGISSLAYLPKQIKKQQFETNKIIQASSIYGFIGLLTVFIIGVPIIIYSIYVNKYFNDSWISLVILSIILILVYFIYNSFKTKNKFYQIIENKFPKITKEINPIFEASLNRKNINLTILISTIIEITGILHVYIAMLALGIQPTFDAAALAYTISVLLMIISPFLRGLGAVEFTMVYILTQFGYSHNQGLATTLLYRVFEFWLPLGFGCLSFMWRGRKLFARIFPAVMIFTLGMINIISVITPPLAERLHFEKLYLPTEFMHLSKLMILFVGIALLITSSYLIKGLKSAWVFALIFAILSFFGNIFKALDYEEAGFAFLTIVLLIYSRNQYPLKTNLKRLRQGFSIFLLAFFAIFIFNVLSFYFIDKRHFGVDFSWNQAFYYTFQNFLLFSENNLVPRTTFAKDFKDINIFFGFSSWILLILAFFRAKNYNIKGIQDYEETEEIVEKYGNSALDYFKLMDDKTLYFSSTIDGFVAYKIGLNLLLFWIMLFVMQSINQI
ncbi:flippase-like domain-containing protein [Empedobacter falsenii]